MMNQSVRKPSKLEQKNFPMNSFTLNLYFRWGIPPMSVCIKHLFTFLFS